AMTGFVIARNGLTKQPRDARHMSRKVIVSATEALGLVLKFEYPADNVLSRYFQQHHVLGQHDRAFVAEAVYGVLRHKRTLEHLIQEATPRRLLLAWLARFSGMSVRDIAPAVSAAEAQSLADLKSVSLDGLASAVRAELP